ncbi:MAG TPA: hypothetical protein VMV46_01520 [Thermoanaerobaculia bacterium]|nr:hypothetical protein [Thermoanaerobaculia bacterium]
MAKTTLKIVWNNGKPRFSTPPGVISLKPHDSVTVKLTGTPSGAGSIDAVTIYYNEVNTGGKDCKGAELCSWTRSGVNSCTMYGISAPSDRKVEIVDQEHPTTEDKYWFGVSGESPSAWSVDPELINKPGG